MAKSKTQPNRASKPETEGLLQDACYIIEQAQAVAYRQINEALI